MAKRKQIDWERIEKDYRAGLLSISEIAKEHDISRTAIQKMAKKKEWQRDLTEEVRKVARLKLVASQVATANVSKEEIVEHGSNQLVEIQLLHRKDVATQRQIANDLMDALKSDPDLKIKEKSEILRNISQSAAKYIPLERQSWNIDGGGDPDDPVKNGAIIMERTHLHAITGGKKESQL